MKDGCLLYVLVTAHKQIIMQSPANYKGHKHLYSCLILKLAFLLKQKTKINIFLFNINLLSMSNLRLQYLRKWKNLSILEKYKNGRNQEKIELFKIVELEEQKDKDEMGEQEEGGKA